MSAENLQVFLRIKPPTNDSDQIIPLLTHFQNQNLSKLTIETARSRHSPIKEQQSYSFSKIFEEFSPEEHTNTDLQQDNLFTQLAKPVIDNCLEGYNGTIFAYGQTGSGKTYTMSGGDEWDERGIIPRVLHYVFKQFKKRKSQIKYQADISFIEIYNEQAYDLLDEMYAEDGAEDIMEGWNKVTFVENESGGFQIKNGSSHVCKTEEQALDLLMMGNYLRKVSCTKLNQASSRSHCIFTLNIKGVQAESQTEIYSKIHLVDLAGSERVSKSHAEGLVLTEAKSINLSLTYLEQVIVALHERSRPALNSKTKTKPKNHIPYRNSLLTTLLKDSLGGNCKTVMIATISSEMTNMDETLSTLRFSQRVRQVTNQISKNQNNAFATKLEMLERENHFLRKKLQKIENENIKLRQEKLESGNSQNQSASLNPGQVEREISDFMCQKSSKIEVNSLLNVNYYFSKMKELYTKKMKEYVQQLTFISDKIAQYDQMLDQKENSKSNAMQVMRQHKR